MTGLNVSSDYVEEKASTVNVMHQIPASLEQGINEDRIHSTHENYRSFYEQIVEFNDPSKGGPQNFDTKCSNGLWNGKGVFWISGQPGSGNSALMKFVADHTSRSSRYFTVGKSSVRGTGN